ncbi:sigma-70 family RNA polymerase sigma factor [Methylobacterium radiodurans]
MLAVAYADPAIVAEPPAHFANLLARLDQALMEADDRDAEAFRTGLLAAVPSLRRYVRSLGCDHVTADDVVQDVLLRAWRSRASFRAGTNLDAWLFTITRNQFFTVKRKRGREVEDVEGEFTDRLSVIPEQPGRVDLQDVRTALDRLPDVMREALVLVALEGLSYEEAAEVMRCQVGTVKSRVSRARERLAGLLGYGGGDLGQDEVTLAVMGARTG